VRLLPVLALLAGLLAGGCSHDPQADYCDAVRDHQEELTEIAADDDAGAIFEALDAYDDLADEAPSDIADDWTDVIGPLRDLQQVLEDRGVDPSTYSAERPPAGLDEQDRQDIEAAAREVGSEQTVTAMAAVEQHALDVCGTPLSR
jgi:sugar phosphate isomerase/epimerase